MRDIFPLWNFKANWKWYKEKNRISQTINYLSVKVTKILNTEGIQVSKDHNLKLKEIIENSDNPFNEETPMGLLWQHQKQQAKGKTKRMRWHPLIIRWWLSVYHKSPAAYNYIASKLNKYLVLPHVNTLKKCINYTTPSTGFNKDVIQMTIIDLKLSELQEYQKNISLTFDEMRFQSGETSVCECFHVDLIQRI